MDNYHITNPVIPGYLERCSQDTITDTFCFKCSIIILFPCSIQKFYMLKSIKNIKKVSFVSGSDMSRQMFFLLINVEMPTIVGIQTFMSRKYTILC